MIFELEPLPNLGLLRTLFFIQVELLSELGSLRTPLFIQVELLSELGSTSDSSLHSGGTSVRTWFYFGLLSSFRRIFCPNLEDIQAASSNSRNFIFTILPNTKSRPF